MTEWLKNLFHRKTKHQKDTYQEQQYPVQKPQEQYTLAKPIAEHTLQFYEEGKKLQQQSTKSNSLRSQERNDQKEKDKDSDQDSLGYTQNDWDEETINFQLQDRMLDCLEQEKYVNSYRESLYASSLSHGSRQSKRLTQMTQSKPLASQKNHQSQGKEISIQSIIGEQFPQTLYTRIAPNSQQQNPNQNINNALQLQPLQKQDLGYIKLENKESSNKPKKNRFEKYMKKPQENQKQSDSTQNQKQQSNESYEDYMNRVLNLKLNSSEILRHKDDSDDLFGGNEKELNDLKNNNKKVEQKQSLQSQTSFVVYDETQNNLHEISLGSQVRSSTNSQIQKGNSNFHFQAQIPQKHSQTEQKPLPLTSDSISQVSALKIQDLHEKKPVSPRNIDSETLKKPNSKPYHILTPPKAHSFESTMTSENEKFPFINSNRSISSVEQGGPVKKNPFQKPKLIKESPQQAKVNFISSFDNLSQINSQQKIGPAPKSPRAKVVFNYGPQVQSKQVFSASSNLNIPIVAPVVSSNPTFHISPLTKPIEAQVKRRIRVIYSEPQAEERFPIFLRRLRRLNSCYPNLWMKGIDHSKVNSNFKEILKSMQSAISVIQLLYKKLWIQRSKLQEPFIKMQQVNSFAQHQSDQKRSLQKDILNIFLTSKWQSYKIDEIEYITPKQRFQRRLFDAKKFEEVIDSYNIFVKHYLNEPMMVFTNSQEIKRYYRVREKTSIIVQNLRIISEDLYTYWLIDCNYPELYYDFLAFLKSRPEDNPTIYRQLCDQIYAKILLAQEYNDPLVKSIVGKTAMDKIKSAYECSRAIC